MASETEVKSFRDMLGAPRLTLTASPQDSTLICPRPIGDHRRRADPQSDRFALEKYRAGGDGKNIVHVVHKTLDGVPVFTAGTALAVEFDELKPQPGEKVIQKELISSFVAIDLHEYLIRLGERGRKTVLTGYMAHVCVSTTARAGADLGKNVVLAVDAIGDRDIPGFTGPEVTDARLKKLGDAFGTVAQSVEVQSRYR
ncbi:hypothetical protein A1O3_01258 [Capronia epimyces CBS 606.96]|uniref:Isochorismatase-like domain-containing protein n=1 Tax=Capronia epimyces CBS 606.96 TaxID=1182542 RepID=W9YTW1_9EURO|nr:uncharacterized protein A1O3_01258 [Capronia epimyces CBS 606.96]EXJ92706.1 hypothetical protein A1O3_01258 [Capronia epimyces CBS 606.96]